MKQLKIKKERKQAQIAWYIMTKWEEKVKKDCDEIIKKSLN